MMPVMRKPRWWIHCLILTAIYVAFLFYLKLYVFQRHDPVGIKLFSTLSLLEKHREDPAEVVILGDSRVLMGIVPELTGTIAYNLAVPSADLQVLRFTLERIIEGARSPSCLIWSFSFSTEPRYRKWGEFFSVYAYYDFLSLADYVRLYQESTAMGVFPASRFGSLEYWAQIVLYKTKILGGSWQALQESVRPRKYREKDFSSRYEKVIEARGHWAVPESRRLKEEEFAGPDHAYLRDGSRIDDEQKLLLSRFLTRQRDLGIKSRFVVMPTAPRVNSSEVERATASVLDAIRKTVPDDLDYAVVRSDASFDDGDFLNATHLNERGAQKLTESFGKRVCRTQGGEASRSQ